MQGFSRPRPPSGPRAGADPDYSGLPQRGSRTLVARGALWLSVSSWGAKGLQTLSLLVLARALAPAQFGILAIATITYQLMTSLNQLGLNDALVYMKDQIEKASRTALTILLAGGLILMAAMWELAPFIAAFFHISQATFVLRGFAVGLPFESIAQVPIGRLTRQLSFARRTVTDLSPSVAGAVVTISLVLTGHPLTGLVAGQITAAVACAVVANIVGPRCLPGWDTAIARRLLRYGGYLSAADVINLALLNVDYIIVGRVLGPVALGTYSLAYRLCYMPYLSIAFVANGAAFPYYCRLPSREGVARAAENLFFLINTMSIPWFIGLVLFADEIGLLGHKWAPATGAVRLLAVYALFLSMCLGALQVLKAVGRTDLVFAGRLLHLAMLTTALILTVRRGITIVALDQAVVAGVIVLVTSLWIVRYASLRPTALARSLCMPLLCGLGMILVVILLGRFPALRASPSWTSLLILGPLAFLVFAVISLLVMPQPLRKGWAALRGRPDG